MALQNTKKSFNNTSSGLPAGITRSAKGPHTKNYGGENAGQMKGGAMDEKFAAPMNDVTPGVDGLGGLYNDIGEMSGFITTGYLDKQSTPFGESAKFNFLPPGMDISNQENTEIHDMPLRRLTSESYPGDGWMPKPRDVEE